MLALTDSRRASDLWIVYRWCRTWIAGVAQYDPAADLVDYPPNALVTLSPIATLPEHLVVPLWTAAGVFVAVLLPLIAVRCTSSSGVLAARCPRPPEVLAARRAVPAETSSAGNEANMWTAWLPILMFWCWTATRTLLQFTSLSLALALGAVLLADAHAAIAGVLLGLSLFKPHVGGALLLWAVVTGRRRVATIAIAVALALVAVYDLRVGESPAVTVENYATTLLAMYSGPGALTGRTGLRGLIVAVAGETPMADGLWIGSACALLIIVIWVARRDPHRQLQHGGIALPSLFLQLSLLAVYHDTNNLILMLPAFMFLWLHRARGEGRLASLPVVALQAALMVDVPTRIGDWAGPRSIAAAIGAHVDRLVVLAAFVAVARAWARTMPVAELEPARPVTRPQVSRVSGASNGAGRAREARLRQ